MNEVDHLVIGGGIVGLATALALAASGDRVAVLESETIGAGASGGPGMRGVRSNARHPSELRLAAAALKLWPELDAMLGHATGFERRGGVELFDGDDVAADGGLERLRIRAGLQSRAGVASRILTRDEVQEELGPVGPRISHGILVDADGVAPPAQATAAFAAAARDAGVSVLEGWRADRVTETTEGVIVRTDAATLSARTVAICANTGTRELVEASFGVALPLWTVGLHVHFLAPESPWELRRLIGHDSRPLAAKTVADGSVQVSGFLKAPRETGRGTSGTLDRMFARSEQLFRETFPIFPAARTTGRVGIAEAFSPDGLQIIDRVPGTRATYVAAGWSGHGFATAPAVGRELASWMLTGRRPELLAPFAATRW